MLAQLYKWAAIVFAVLAVAAVVTAILFHSAARDSRVRADAEHERANVLAQQVIRADQIIREERERAERMTVIAGQYERDKADAQAGYERDLADLRAGNLKLRQRWAATATDAVSAAGRSAAELDAAAADREASAARIVRAARDADAQIRGLQAVVKADREATP